MSAEAGAAMMQALRRLGSNPTGAAPNKRAT
jgi:hypothetical protein